MRHTGAVLLLLLGVAWMTAAATAVRSASRIWLRHWVERRLRGRNVGALYLERPQRLLVAAASGVALALFGTGVLIAEDDSGIRLVARVAIAAVVFLVAGQLVPRAIGRRWSNALVPVLIPVLRVVDILSWPLAIIVRAAVRPLTRHEVTTQKEDERADLEELLREGELEGVGEREEIALISGVVQFGEKTVREVMTPRDAVFAVDIALGPAEVANRIAQAHYSRVPVYEGTIDTILGMVHAFDVLKAGRSRMPVLRPVSVAPASMPCNELLFEMLRQRRHLAVVVEADARSAGIVTLEDLLEELVGEIQDEHDEPVAVATLPAPSLPRVAS